MTKHAVLALSGGLDSFSLLATLLVSKEYSHIHCYNFNYGQKHAVELVKAALLAQKMQDAGQPVSMQTIDLRDAFSDSQSALGANTVGEIPQGHYDAENQKSTVVENRNVIFSSIIYGKALAISKKYDVDVDISLGVHAQDNSNYPDCRPESVEMAKELFRISNWGSERIDYKAPFVTFTKGSVLKSGLESLAKLGFTEGEIKQFYSITHSCYDPQNGKACGKCATCVDRLAAFKEAGMEDPAEYAYRPE